MYIVFRGHTLWYVPFLQWMHVTLTLLLDCRQFACSVKRNSTRTGMRWPWNSCDPCCVLLWWNVRHPAAWETVSIESAVVWGNVEGGRSGGERPKHVTSAVASYKLTSTVTSCDSTYTLSCAEAYVSSLYPANHRKLGVHESSKWSSWRHKRCVEDTYRRRNDVNIASMALKMLRGNFKVCLHSITYI